MKLANRAIVAGCFAVVLGGASQGQVPVSSENRYTILDNDGCVYDFGLQAPETPAYVNSYVMENRCAGRFFTVFASETYADGRSPRDGQFTLGPGRRRVAHLRRGDTYRVRYIEES